MGKSCIFAPTALRILILLQTSDYSKMIFQITLYKSERKISYRCYNVYLPDLPQKVVAYRSILPGKSKTPNVASLFLCMSTKKNCNTLIGLPITAP